MRLFWRRIVDIFYCEIYSELKQKVSNYIKDQLDLLFCDFEIFSASNCTEKLY